MCIAISVYIISLIRITINSYGRILSFPDLLVTAFPSWTVSKAKDGEAFSGFTVFFSQPFRQKRFRKRKTAKHSPASPSFFIHSSISLSSRSDRVCFSSSVSLLKNSSRNASRSPRISSALAVPISVSLSTVALRSVSSAVRTT